jgi:hypothetical protein
VFIISINFKYYLYFQENPLCAFTEFLMESVAKKNFKGSIKSLKTFKADWFSMKINVSLSALNGDFTHILRNL